MLLEIFFKWYKKKIMFSVPGTLSPPTIPPTSFCIFICNTLEALYLVSYNLHPTNSMAPLKIGTISCQQLFFAMHQWMYRLLDDHLNCWCWFSEKSSGFQSTVISPVLSNQPHPSRSPCWQQWCKTTFTQHVTMTLQFSQLIYQHRPNCLVSH